VSKRLVSVILGTGIGAALAGCATGNGEVPLIFGSSNVYGVSIGGSVADTGGEFVVGYKGLDLALVPVSAVQGGTETFVGANAGSGHLDSYSVIGQFSAQAGRRADGANAGLGKFFATGWAAQNIANGFARKMGAYGRTGVQECGTAKPAATAGAVQAAAPGAAAPDGPGPWPALMISAPIAGKAPTAGARLIFAQYGYKALAIDGSALDTGVKLTLGVRDRNIAFIPTIGRDAAGNLVWLEAGSPSGRDVLSVLGQFESDDRVQSQAGEGNGKGISSGLEKFFSTGGAARILSEGFKVKLCEEYVARATAQPGGGQQAEAPAPQPAKLLSPEALR
jgi:hypothetical protein